MQSIHSDGLFKVLLRRGDFKRNYLFCNICIGWAKSEVLRLQERRSSQNPPENPQYSPISEPGANRDTPDPFSEAMVDPINDPMMMETHSVIGKRLANPTDSPLHLGNRKYAVHASQSETIRSDICLQFSQQCHL